MNMPPHTRGDMDAAFRRLRDLEYDDVELMICDPDRLDRGVVEQLSSTSGIEIPALRTGQSFG